MAAYGFGAQFRDYETGAQTDSSDVPTGASYCIYESYIEYRFYKMSDPNVDAVGYNLMYISDIDTYISATDTNETVYVNRPGLVNDMVYLDSATTIETEKDDDSYYFYGTTSDEATEVSTISFRTEFTGGDYEYNIIGCYGARCMTAFFDTWYYTITSKIYTKSSASSSYSLDTTGGKISRTTSTTARTYGTQSSTASVSLRAYWKNSYTYTATAKTGYHLVQINASGTTSTSSSSYTFSSVTADQYFYAYFMANSYSVLFDGNGATSGTTDDMEDLYYDTTYTLNTNGFVRSGYTFTGWNTEADGSGTSYTDEESFSNLTSTNGGTVTLYAQWEEDSGTISVYYVDINTDEILDLYSYTGSVGETVTTSGKEIDGYTLVESPDTEDYTLTTEDINVYYYYAKDSNVIVYYLNYYTDEEITESETIEGYEGLSYTTEEKEIDGYTYLSNSGNTEGTMSSETTYVYYYYEQLISITITKVSTETSTDEDGNTVYTYLEGVQFQLYELICDNAAHNHDTDEDLIDTADYDEDCWELIGTYTTEEDGTFILSNLPISGIYRLIETKTIEDYVLPSGQWKIEFDYDDNLTGTTYTVNGVELQVTGINNPPAISLIDDTLYLYNTESYDIPTTGLLGFDDFWKIGVPIILMGMIIYPIRKKKKVSKSKFGSTRESVNNARHIINNWDKRK